MKDKSKRCLNFIRKSFVFDNTQLRARIVRNANCDDEVDIFDMIIAADSFETADGDDDWNHNANFTPLWDLNNIFDIVTLISHCGETEP